jgi:hypothetical protein
MLPECAAQMKPPATAIAPSQSTFIRPCRSAMRPVQMPPIPRQTIMKV